MKSGGVHPDRRTWLLVLFWAEVVLAAASAVLAMTTAIHPDWIESLTGLDPDAGSGSAEWAVTLILALVAVALAVGARFTRSALRPAHR
jgi:hypothetical protein